MFKKKKTQPQNQPQVFELEPVSNSPGPRKCADGASMSSLKAATELNNKETFKDEKVTGKMSAGSEKQRKQMNGFIDANHVSGGVAEKDGNVTTMSNGRSGPGNMKPVSDINQTQNTDSLSNSTGNSTANVKENGVINGYPSQNNGTIPNSPANQQGKRVMNSTVFKRETDKGNPAKSLNQQTNGTTHQMSVAVDVHRPQTPGSDSGKKSKEEDGSERGTSSTSNARPRSKQPSIEEVEKAVFVDPKEENAGSNTRPMSANEIPGTVSSDFDNDAQQISGNTTAKENQSSKVKEMKNQNTSLRNSTPPDSGRKAAGESPNGKSTGIGKQNNDGGGVEERSKSRPVSEQGKLGQDRPGTSGQPRPGTSGQSVSGQPRPGTSGQSVSPDGQVVGTPEGKSSRVRFSIGADIEELDSKSPRPDTVAGQQKQHLKQQDAEQPSSSRSSINQKPVAMDSKNDVDKEEEDDQQKKKKTVQHKSRMHALLAKRKGEEPPKESPRDESEERVKKIKKPDILKMLDVRLKALDVFIKRAYPEESLMAKHEINPRRVKRNKKLYSRWEETTEVLSMQELLVRLTDARARKGQYSSTESDEAGTAALGARVTPEGQSSDDMGSNSPGKVADDTEAKDGKATKKAQEKNLSSKDDNTGNSGAFTDRSENSLTDSTSSKTSSVAPDKSKTSEAATKASATKPNKKNQAGENVNKGAAS